jgi:hypothetical protein
MGKQRTVDKKQISITSAKNAPRFPTGTIIKVEAKFSRERYL